MTFEEKLGISLGLGISAVVVFGAITLAFKQPTLIPTKPLPVMISAASIAAPEDAEIAAQHRELFFGQDDRVVIPAPYPEPFAAIGQLVTKNDYTCTATLVAPDLAVTAAHCFMMEAKKADTGLWFKAGFHQGQYQAKYQVLTQVFHPAFKRGLQYKGEDVYILPQAAEHDIAWLKLKFVDGVAPKPMPLFEGGRAELASAFRSAKMLLNQGGFAEDHDAILTAHLACQLSEFRANNTLYHRCDTLSGDSGSPIWLTTASGPLLIGVQSSAPDWFNRNKADNVGVTVLQLPIKP
ncbi:MULTISPECIES: trypsin-like serine peptidase [Deefgea]|uniref:Trypsin-like serine protease n=1 Tax=Deefgea chitinilytica TaxID=570276 RepID=A0ABS2CDH7_9NEIS|nr:MULTISPECIES: trypsin-like serine protease [Deefgea]MBM5572112.1 trypsin-like serine protease [Deefgea chitinilytica]MBM9889347.1 trypsin-like serine protease [Deefgea sp. CFH1-16]